MVVEEVEPQLSINVMVRIRPLPAALQGSGTCSVHNSRRIVVSEGDGFERSSSLMGSPLADSGSANSSPRKQLSRNHSPTRMREHVVDHVFCDETGCSQEDVFRVVGAPVLRASLAGYNTCVFAYGQTGSGKTHTMLGPRHDEGIALTIIRRLFATTDARAETHPHLKTKVDFSFMEIYNEKVRDLFDAKQGDAVERRVREHPTRGVFVQGLKQERVSDAAEAIRFMARGMAERATAGTRMNSQSSRSHAVLQLKIATADASVGEHSFSTLNLVDLAGSENIERSGAKGDRLEEAVSINQSLSTLRLVFDRLLEHQGSHKQVYVPYRDSLLTRVLQDSLGGNSRTTMVACVSDDPSNADATRHTLSYAVKANAIKCTAHRNKARAAQQLGSLQEELTRLRAAINQRERDADEKLAERDEALEAMRADVEDKELELLDAQTRHEELESLLDAKSQALDEAVQELKQNEIMSAWRRAGIKGRLEKEKQVMEEKKVEVADALQTEIERHAEEVASLTEKLSKSEQQFVRCSDRLHVSEFACSVVEVRLKELQCRSRVEDEELASRASITALEHRSVLSSHACRERMLEVELDSLRQKLARQQQQNAQLGEDNQALQNALSDLQASTKREHSALREEIEQLDEAVKARTAAVRRGERKAALAEEQMELNQQQAAERIRAAVAKTAAAERLASSRLEELGLAAERLREACTEIDGLAAKANARDERVYVIAALEADNQALRTLLLQSGLAPPKPSPLLAPGGPLSPSRGGRVRAADMMRAASKPAADMGSPGSALRQPGRGKASVSAARKSASPALRQ